MNHRDTETQRGAIRPVEGVTHLVSVMAGLDPAIQDAATALDARIKSGHDYRGKHPLPLCLCVSVVQLPAMRTRDGQRVA